MNVLKSWLENNRGQGRQVLLLELKKVYPHFTSTSLSQYAHGRRIPEKGKAEIIARFIGVPLEAIPFRMVNKPTAEMLPVPDSGNGTPECKPSFFRKLMKLASN